MSDHWWEEELLGREVACVLGHWGGADIAERTVTHPSCHNQFMGNSYTPRWSAHLLQPPKEATS